jgi:hypothetical protein
LIRFSALIFLLLCLAPAAVRQADAQARAVGAIAQASQADATPTLVVSPVDIAAGDTVAVTGTGFLAAETVDLQLATTGAVTSTEHLHYFKADASGGFSSDALTIPSAIPAGSYDLLARGGTSTAKAAIHITVAAAKLTVDQTAIAPLDKIHVSGTHFGPDETVIFSLSSISGTVAISLGHTVATHAGAFGPTVITLPFGIPSGSLRLTASGQTSHLQASVAVTVTAPTPTLTVSPSDAKPGDRVTISGTHLQPGEVVVVDLVALSTSARLGETHVRSSGTFSLSAKIPSATPQGTVSVVATGSTSRLSVTRQISIGALAALLHLGDHSIKAGAAVRVSGSGFIPGETITLLLKGGKIASLNLGLVVAGTTGSFAISRLIIPSLVPSGPYSVVAFGQTSGRSANADLTVQAPPPSTPLLSILGGVPGPGGSFLLTPGGIAEIAGSNFAPGAHVILRLATGTTTISLGTLTVSARGALGPAGITLPASVPAGAYALEAVVGGTKVTSLAVHVAALAPRLSLSTNTLVPGSTVGVRGFGYAPGEQIVLSLNGAALATTPSAVVANAQGTFNAQFVVPAAVLNGNNTVSAVGASSRAGAQAAATAHLAVATRWYFANGDTTGTTSTTISMLNPGDAQATVKMTFLYQVGPPQTYTEMVPAHRQVSVGLGLVAGAGRQVSTILEADQRISASSTISYADGDSSTALGASGASTTWYLAEGYTNGSFKEYLHVMNPNSTYATIDVRFLPFNNKPAREARFVMQPNSTIQIDAGQYMPGQSISTIVTSDHPVVVERSMRFGRNGRGAHDKIGVTSASTVWLFAQGESGPNEQTFFTVLNPNQAAPAAVTATFFDSKGRPVGSKTIIVDPLHRGNIKLNDVLPNAQVATTLTSNVPVVVERPYYLGPADLSQAPSGSVIFGGNGGGRSWAFPSGSTAPGTQSQLFLYNPGLKAVVVHATFYSYTGTMVTQDYTLAPNSDTVLPVNGVPGLPPGNYGATLKSAGGVFLAEQSDVNAQRGQLDSVQGIAQ